ncbi:uncharacterized protein BJ212DRAFT_1483013 [Suillus subaureus]|uniref:WW domain-containing protein n=1 Tax=Suillus subaureus TaxID=48587 RepID=A0A9P7E709_9AGAM|nr:uncharacterized protein BJ212DRAFT_1483013 [Suillus subaureus]KAG1812958.1 hypothetical protein BJ212DRAFT_1483013 [Suillus subaureus]
MMKLRFLAHILRAFQRWLLRLARHSASSLSVFLSSLRLFATGRSKPGVRRSTTKPRLPRRAFLRPLEADTVEENLYTCSSFLPPGEIQEVAREPLSLSDFPYATISPSQPPRHVERENTSMSLPETTMGSSLILSMGESPTRYAPYTKPVRSRRVTIHNPVADFHRRSTDPVTVPLDLPTQAVPVSDPVIGSHNIALPCSEEQLGPGQPGPEVGMVYDNLQIGLLVAEEVRRYEIYTPRSSLPSQIIVPAMTVKFPLHDMAIPPGWTTLVHPQGSRYFVNAERRTFTQMNICDEKIYNVIKQFMDCLLRSLRDESEDLELDMAQVDLVIEPKFSTDTNTVVCCYYFANHRDRCLFWLDEYSTEDILSECNGVENLSHIRLAIQAQYWKHCDYFPCLCPITQNLVDEVKDMLIYAECDHLTSRHSTAPFDIIEIRDYISIIDMIKVHSTAGESMHRCHAAIVIGRIMYAFSRNHFINSHGENCVRLAFDQTVHPYTPSLLIVIIAPLLFLDPMALVRELHTIFVDNTPSSERWNTFNLNLNGQLQDSTLLATVLLNANVGFLSINSVDAGGRSPVQVASYMSLVSSLGSMILGLLLVSHNRSMGQLGTVLQTEVFLSGLGEKERRLERLAIIYSLPKTLLIMVFFFAAFSVHWWSPGDQTTRAVVGSVIMVALVMISYGIIRAKCGGDRWWRPLVLPLARIVMKLLTYLADVMKQVMVSTGMRKAHVVQDPSSHTEGIILALPSFPARHFQTNAEVDISGRSTSHPTTSPDLLPSPDDHEHHPGSSIPQTRSSQPTTSADSPPQPHVSIFAPPSSDTHTGPGDLPGVGSLQQIREIQLVFQSTAEVRYEPDVAPLGVPGFSCIEGREAVNYTANVVEEPEELEHPQPSPS